MEERKYEEDIDACLEDFGGYVQRMRKKKGLTFEALAEVTNLSPSFLYRLERNYRGCTLSNKVIILLDGFGWNKEKVLAYLEKVIDNKEDLKRISQ